MQAPRLLRKLCLAAAAGAGLAAPAFAQAGDVRISIHVPWLVPSVVAALFPPPPPLPPSPHHLSVSDTTKTIRGGVAIDGRSFVAGGLHYRIDGLVPSEPGSPDEARARGDLQRLLDTGAMKVNLLETQPGGFRIVRLERNG